MDIVLAKERLVGYLEENGRRRTVEGRKGQQWIYMGTFRFAVSIGLFENFHFAWATIFKLSRRVMPRAA